VTEVAGRFGVTRQSVHRWLRRHASAGLAGLADRSTIPASCPRRDKTLRREFLDDKVFVDIDEAQAQVDAWVWHYNHDRPHQGIGMVAPFEQFRVADTEPFEEPEAETMEPVTT
jgi:transposase InsO family protein